ncbi:MAG: Gfo/Idh/MocA family oxidoreductase [Acidobacteria bacterium]|nr:Gfo/Idh/MocA family oxidoreductase [Acidobacteriota bacterium]
MSNEAPRRDILKSGALALGAPAVLSALQATKAIKVGLVGCGGRGSGAAAQALKADDFSNLTAMADVFQERIDDSVARLERIHKDKVKVEKANMYVGLDAYKKLIDSDIDVVLLATPPGFRPEQLRYAIEKGKHVFCEKPMAVDAPGVRHVMETVRMAKEKKLNLVAGFCWRYSNYIVEVFDRVAKGDIGEIVTYYATYYTNPVKPMPPASDRPAGMSDVEWQIRNWYNFTWTCGDSLVEQAIHSVDKVAWAMKDQPPVSCVAVGGRQIPAHDGNIYDHFEVNYLYPNGVRAMVANRQIEGCYNENSDYILGTKGQAIIGRGPNPRIVGANEWTYSGQKYDMYQREHDILFQAIRKGEVLNDGDRMCSSTMLGIMGRMAAYTGQQITWEQALNSQERLVPEKLDWNGKLDVPPLAQPGKTRFL